MSAEAFPAFFEQAVALYAAESIAAGRFTESDALDRSRADNAKLLSEGIATAGQFFFEVVATDQNNPVGYLWLAAMPRGSTKVAFVYQIIIKPEHRRKGHARAALLAAETFAVAQGLSGIALHVFAHNVGAQALYRALGYHIASLNMLKPLGGGAA